MGVLDYTIVVHPRRKRHLRTLASEHHRAGRGGPAAAASSGSSWPAMVGHGRVSLLPHGETQHDVPPVRAPETAPSSPQKTRQIRPSRPQLGTTPPVVSRFRERLCAGVEPARRGRRQAIRSGGIGACGLACRRWRPDMGASPNIAAGARPSFGPWTGPLRGHNFGWAAANNALATPRDDRWAGLGAMVAARAIPSRCRGIHGGFNSAAARPDRI